MRSQIGSSASAGMAPGLTICGLRSGHPAIAVWLSRQTSRSSGPLSREIVSGSSLATLAAATALELFIVRVEEPADA